MNDLRKRTLVTQFAGFYAGVSKSGFAGGTGIILTPMLAMLMPAKESLALILPLLVASDIVNIGMFWGEWQLPTVLPLLPGAAAGIFLATPILKHLPEYWVKKTLGAMALFFVPLQAARMTVWQELTPTFIGSPWGITVGVIAGFLAGVFSTMAHLGGVITSVYFLLVLPKEGLNTALVGTATIYYLFGNTLKLVTYTHAGIITAKTWRAIPVMLPLLGVGLVTGKAINTYFSGPRVDYFVYIILALVLWMAWNLLKEPRPGKLP